MKKFEFEIDGQIKNLVFAAHIGIFDQGNETVNIVGVYQNGKKI